VVRGEGEIRDVIGWDEGEKQGGGICRPPLYIVQGGFAIVRCCATWGIGLREANDA
jgi:hypothetical protein